MYGRLGSGSRKRQSLDPSCPSLRGGGTVPVCPPRFENGLNDGSDQGWENKFRFVQHDATSFATYRESIKKNEFVVKKKRTENIDMIHHEEIKYMANERKKYSIHPHVGKKQEKSTKKKNTHE